MDMSDTMFCPELDILKPIDPSISHSDDYEIYTLNNAVVVSESNGQLANLLDAYADTPLRVEGRLEALGRGQMKNLVRKPFKPVDVEITSVTRFSYGQMTDGELVIWALGDAGWFEIRPADSYVEIFNDMVEAVDLLYFITDIYNEPRKRGGGPTASLIFQEYAEDERFECADAASAVQVSHKHHRFLIMCFLNRAQGIGWSNTPIYQYFRRQYPKVFETSKARIQGRFVRPDPPASKGTRSSKVSPAPSSTVTNNLPRRGRPPLSAPQPFKARKKNENWWGAAALFEFMQKAVNQRVLRLGHHHITLDKVSMLVTKRYEIEDQETARSVLLVHAENICYMIDYPRRKSLRIWAEEPIYAELKAGHNLSATEQRRAEGVELRPRNDHATLKDEASDLSDSSDEEDDLGAVTTPVRRPPGRRKKGRLSILRPKSSKGSKYSGKSKGKGFKRSGKGKMPVEEDTENSHSGAEEDARDEDGDADIAQEGSDSGMAVDTPTQALSPNSQKRKFIAIDADEAEEKGRRKRPASESISPGSETHSSAAEEEAYTPPATTDAEDGETETGSTNENEEDEAGIPIPLRHRAPNLPTEAHSPNNTSTNPAPPLASTPLPTHAPNGPRGSWICPFDGCSQRIYGAAKDLGQQLITEHLEDHAKGRHQYTNILIREEEKLRLPVSHLLKKIREMTESATPLFPPPSTTTTEATGSGAPPTRVQPQFVQRKV